MDDPKSQWMTAQEVADALDLNLHTVCDMINAGEVVGVLRAKRPYRISRGAFEAWLATGAR